jgi:hypothetical protein
MLGLTLTGGNGVGAGENGVGGAVWAAGVLSMTRCTLVGNSAGIAGGAIYLSDFAAATLTQCTLTGNHAGEGGAIHVMSGSAILTHCTVSGNSGSGGGILIHSGVLTLRNSIVAGNNSSGSGDDLLFVSGNLSPSYIRSGANIVQSVIELGLVNSSGPPEIISAPQLAPLGNYGGPTQTMALLPGSPARNAAAVLSPAITTDQRGFPIVGTPDIGAYETGTFKDFDTWSWEAKGSLLDFNTDGENDGATNGLEYATRRDPMLSDPSLAPEFTFNGGGHGFRFRYQKEATDLRYIVQRSTDLGATGAWQEIYRLDTRTGVITENGVTGAENPATGLIDLTDPTASPRSFWRLLIERTP